jgi:hypothetical protein
MHILAMTAWYIEANFRNIVCFPQKMPSKTFTDYSESSDELKFVLIFYINQHGLFILQLSGFVTTYNLIRQNFNRVKTTNLNTGYNF